MKNQFDEIKCIGISIWTRRKCAQSLISKLVSLIYLFFFFFVLVFLLRHDQTTTEVFGLSKKIGSHKLIQIKHLKIKCTFHLKYTLKYADWVCFTIYIWCRNSVFISLNQHEKNLWKMWQNAFSGMDWN